MFFIKGIGIGQFGLVQGEVVVKVGGQISLWFFQIVKMGNFF